MGLILVWIYGRAKFTTEVQATEIHVGIYSLTDPCYMYSFGSLDLMERQNSNTQKTLTPLLYILDAWETILHIFCRASLHSQFPNSTLYLQQIHMCVQLSHHLPHRPIS